VTTGAVKAQRLEQFTSRDLTVLVTHNVGGIAKSIVLASVYLPYDSSDLPLSKELADLVEYCKEQEHPLLVGCDTNAHHICWGSSNNNRRGPVRISNHHRFGYSGYRKLTNFCSFKQTRNN